MRKKKHELAAVTFIVGFMWSTKITTVIIQQLNKNSLSDLTDHAYIDGASIDFYSWAADSCMVINVNSVLVCKDMYGRRQFIKNLQQIYRSEATLTLFYFLFSGFQYSTLYTLNSYNKCHIVHLFAAYIYFVLQASH
jgi:hypothetical protein